MARPGLVTGFAEIARRRHSSGSPADLLLTSGTVSGVHKGGFSKGGFSNLCVIIIIIIYFVFIIIIINIIITITPLLSLLSLLLLNPPL